MRTKHTPGPWELGEISMLDGFEGCSIDAKGSCEEELATVWGIDKRGEANAKLIAAAPDLLEALQDLLESVCKEGWVQQDGSLWPEQTKAIKAIDKALGN